MIYFKEIDLPNFEIIQNKINLYFSKWAVLPIGFTLLNKEKIRQICPEIESDLLSLNIKIQNIGAYITYNEEDSKVHIDYINPLWNQCRLNIPIRNTIGSKTEFYTGGNYEKVTQPNELSYLESIDNTAIKVCEVELTKPTIIRIQVPHRVRTNLESVPRICLTVFTDVDMVKFLDNV
jgi:hypothetical protein